MKYIIFGAGDTGRASIDAFGRDNIAFFIDNNPKKQTMKFEGFDVLSLSDAISRIGETQIVLAVMPKYEKEIISQLEDYGISNFIKANSVIYEQRRLRLMERKDNVDIYNRCIQWILCHSIDNKGIAVSSSENIIYPEVTGYYIPTLIRWGYRDLAISYAKCLMEIQRDDGAWNGPHNDTPYVFDTGQILKGLIAISSILPEAIPTAVRGADWVLSNVQSDGRLTTPDSTEWGDEDTCSELIHIYCLSPLVELSEITGDVKYKNAGIRILDYYLDNHYERITNFHHLSHFHAYLMEALLDMGREDVAAVAMHNMEKYQKENGAVPAYNNCDWVCSTGLFQLALVWFRLGEVERGNRAFTYACNLQNKSGGWYGSYISEENPNESNSYFPLSEISWANKYFLDALYEKNGAEFNISAPMFMDRINCEDGRYNVIKTHAKRITTGGVIADIGCGKGRYLRNLIEDISGIHFVGVDISKSVLEFIKDENIELCLGSLTNIPLKDNAVDMAYSCEALEHAIDISSAIREMARITRNGGRIVIVDKNKEHLGRYEITEWEQWFDIEALRNIMLEYCTDVEIETSINYDDNPADGVFCAWIGRVK